MLSIEEILKALELTTILSLKYHDVLQNLDWM